MQLRCVWRCFHMPALPAEKVDVRAEASLCTPLLGLCQWLQLCTGRLQMLRSMQHAMQNLDQYFVGLLPAGHPCEGGLSARFRQCSLCPPCQASTALPRIDEECQQIVCSRGQCL